jgi:hypothetical protein
MIEEVKKYTDEQGKSVTAYVPMSLTEDSNKDTKSLTHYDGTVGIRTPVGVQPIQFPFPENFSLEQCFEKFEEIANVEVEKIMTEAKKKHDEENLIVTPDQVKGKKISFKP